MEGWYTGNVQLLHIHMIMRQKDQVIEKSNGWKADMQVNLNIDLIAYTCTYMSTLPDSVGVSRIFKNFLPPGMVIPPDFTITSPPGNCTWPSCVSHLFPAWWKVVTADQGYQNTLTKLCFTPFPRLVKGSDRRSRLSKHASLNLINDCTICLIVLITSTGLITPMN